MGSKTSSLLNSMAPLKLTAALLTTVVGVEAGRKKLHAVASFSDSNGYMDGEVAMLKKQWNYDLTIKDVAGLEEKLKEMGRECDLSSTPLNFHVHDKWTYGDSKSFGVGTECDADFTGGHYKTYQNPTCAFEATWPEIPETCDDEPYPQDKECCVPTCAPVCDANGDGKTCKPWQTMMCEVGDLSGKAGQAVPETLSGNIMYEGNFRKDKSMKSKVVKDFDERSIVFHCGSPRIFCAPLKVMKRAVDDSSDN